MSRAFAMLEEQFGFVPRLFRAQGCVPRLVEAEAALMQQILWNDGGRARGQKEGALAAVGGALGCRYVMALHHQMMQIFGGAGAGSAPDARVVALGVFECALAEALAVEPDFAVPENVPELQLEAVGANGLSEGEAEAQRMILLPDDLLSRDQKDRILNAGWDWRKAGLSMEQMVEAAAVAAFGAYLEARKNAHLFAPVKRLTDQAVPADPDLEAVLRAQSGDLDAFEELVHRHSRRVYRTLLGILGDADGARDAMQDTFLKAIQHLGGFRRQSKFSTWLLSIAGNTGVQRVRERRHLESLDGDGEECEDFRPRQLQAWAANPEQLYSESERRLLVEGAVMRLPAKYRSVLMLRDIEQMSTEDAAAALGLGIPALKARLLRGRLMLREALAPHFTVVAKGAPR